MQAAKSFSSVPIAGVAAFVKTKRAPVKDTCAKEMNGLKEFLRHVASHAPDSYLLEDVLRQQLMGMDTCGPPTTVTLNKILFVVMCSLNKTERVDALNQTWLAWLPPQNVILLSDARIPGFPMTILPSLPADEHIKSKYPHPTNYQAANLRHLRSVQWLGKVNSTALQNIDWVFFVDDDTFVNLPMLLMFLQNVPPSLPVLFGQYWDTPWEGK